MLSSAGWILIQRYRRWANTKPAFLSQQTQDAEPIVGLMLVQRRMQWANIKPALVCDGRRVNIP